MANNSTEKKNLIQIDTQYFNLYIKGKPVHPTARELSSYQTDLKSKITFTFPSDKNAYLKYYHPIKDKLVLAEDHSVEIYPLFYEQQDYDMYIESESRELSFYHQNKNIRESISHPPDNNKNLYGSINFGSDIGYTEFEIRDKNNLLLTFTIEIFPSKLDYRKDYNQLLDEVNEEVYNLAYDFLRKTYQNMRPREAQETSEAEFYTILKTIFDDFMNAFNRIKESPHHRLIEERSVRRASKVKKTNRQSIKWINKNSRHYNKDLELPEKILAVDKTISFDTFENKFVCWIFNQLVKRLRRFKKNYQENKMNPDNQIVEQIDKMKSQLNFQLHKSFLKEVGDLYKINSISLVLQMAPGYRELYKLYLILLKGLSLNGDIFQLSIKQLWKLYEYWTFLKLNKILSDKFKLLKHDIISINRNGITVNLSKGTDAEVKYKNPATDETFTLGYNKTPDDKPTTGQKPDNILSLQKENSNIKYKFIFDAKYRINPASKGSRYRDKYSNPGPEESTINTMHRYRDAIVEEAGFNRTMVGAYVLFPYSDEEEFKSHKFYKSIDKVNIGAFPFLPRSNKLISDFLENIINESEVSNYERNVLPKGIKEYQNKIDFTENVLVGTLRKEKQLEYLKNNDIYYMPYTQSVLAKDLEYITIYQSKKIFGSESGVRLYGKIEEIEVKERKKINFTSDSNPEKLYIVFTIKKWQKLDNPVLPEGYGISSSHIYTNFMLLNRANTLPELSIRSLKEWRIWLELKRMKKEINVKLGNNSIEELSSIDGFTIDNIDITISDNKLICKTKDKSVKEFQYNKFIKNPRMILKSLF